MDQYRAMPGLSKHELDNFAVAPSYYKHKKGQDWKPSRSMELGTLIHSLILEGRTDYVVGPQVDKRTKAGKEEWQAFCEEHLGKAIVTEDEGSMIAGCMEACTPLLSTVEADFDDDVEVSAFWMRGGVNAKGRPDLIGSIAGELSIIDLKTTAGMSSFDSKFWSFRYDVQAAWYQYGIHQAMELDELPAFWFLVVDTEAPHLAQFVRASSALLADANTKIDAELAYFKRCQVGDVWPGLPETRLMLPRQW
jgi:exodeoxyribonuclease VIII